MLRHRSIAVIAAIVPAFAAACFEDDYAVEPNASLADLTQLRLRADASRVIVGGSDPHLETRLNVVIEYDALAFQLAHDGECALLDRSLSAAWSGITQRFDGRGTLRSGECPVLYHSMVVDGLGDTALAFGDDSDVISVRFDDPLSGRWASLPVTPPALQAGDQVDLTVSHPDEFEGAYVAYDNGVYSFAVQSTVADGTATLTMPSPLSFTGDAVLVASLGRAEAAVVSCPAGIECTLLLATEYRSDIRLAP